MNQQDDNNIVSFPTTPNVSSDVLPIPLFDHDLICDQLSPGLIVRARADYKNFRKGMIGVCAGIVFDNEGNNHSDHYYFAFENHQVESLSGWLVEMFLEHIPESRIYPPGAKYRFSCVSRLEVDVRRGLFNGAFSRPRISDTHPNLHLVR